MVLKDIIRKLFRMDSIKRELDKLETIENYIDKYGEPELTMNHMFIYVPKNDKEIKFLYTKDENGQYNYRKVRRVYCWESFSIFSTSDEKDIDKKEIIWKVIYK